MEIIEGAGQHTGTGAAHYIEQLRVPDLSLGTYSLPAGASDPQEPHSEDEIYLCTTGRATLWTPTASAEMTPGSVVFVPANEEHHFIDVVEDFTVLVIFGPAELSRS